MVLTGGVSHDFTLLQLLYESPIFMMLQRVLGISPTSMAALICDLGEGQVAPVSECEVSVRYPQLGDPTSPQLGGKRC